MDEKHRQYCIKLGNPFMGDDRYQKTYEDYNNIENIWNNNNNNESNFNWIKNTKK